MKQILKFWGCHGDPSNCLPMHIGLNEIAQVYSLKQIEYLPQFLGPDVKLGATLWFDMAF